MKHLPTFENFQLNEGLIGKLAKIFSPKDYKAAINYVKSQCEEKDCECTKECIKGLLKDMLYKPTIKVLVGKREYVKTFEEDSTLMKSVVEEIYKDIKKEEK